jgi:hypothetical protein
LETHSLPKTSKPKSRLPKQIISAHTEILGRKIIQAEKQLERANQNIMDRETEPQTSEITGRIPVRRNMVVPGSRDAPKFSSKRPQELRRFLRQLEDLWAEAGVTDDEEKKISVVKYVDPESEEEWRSLETFDNGSWEQFKDEVIENYPEAAAAERGTPARLRQICRDAGGIALGDLSPLYAYRRAFTTEAHKLCKPPAVMSNRELVELFMSGLSQNLAQAVLQYLGTQPKALLEDLAKGKGKKSDLERRPEDRYDFNDICKAAVQVSENAQGMFRLSSDKPENNKPRSLTMVQMSTEKMPALAEKVEALEEIQAREKDRAMVTEKQFGCKLEAIDNSLKALLARAEEKGAAALQQSFSGNNASSQAEIQQRWVKNPQGMECFGCGGDDHFQDKCEKIKHHIKLGNLKYNQEGRIRLGNGNRVPNFPAGASLIERMEKYYSSRPPAQTYLGASSFEEVEERSVNAYTRNSEPIDNSMNVRERKLALLEKELQLKERENLLLAKQLKLEEKIEDKPNRSAKTSYILGLLDQLTDEELGSIKDPKLGFV